MSEEIRGLCLVRGCEWMTSVPANTGMESETLAYVNGLLAAHRETAHPNHQLQRQKCPLCRWVNSAWSLPGEQYELDRKDLQRSWSRHMTEDHPSVRGPGATMITATLCPLDVASADGRVIAEGALRLASEGGVPLVNADGEPVGRISALREENDYVVVEGFVRDDLLVDRDREELHHGVKLPVSFAVMPEDKRVHPLRVTSAKLREVRMSGPGNMPVWANTGMVAVDPVQPEKPALLLPGRSVQAAMMSVDAALRPLRDAMEEWARLLAPAVAQLVTALEAYTKRLAEGPSVMEVKLPDAQTMIADIIARSGEPDWRQYVGKPPVPEGPQDWPRLPRNGKRAPTGCEMCEAPVDGRHPADCPGA